MGDVSVEHDLSFLDGHFLLPRTVRSTSHAGDTAGFDPDAAVSYFLEALNFSEKEVAGQMKEALTVATGGGVDEGKGRRQGLGLGRKRARFSMIPNKSNHESGGVNFISNANHIADPDEYFAAIERNIFAEKELKKLKGDVTDDILKDNIFRSRRQRRPGLLERRTSLKHFSQELTDIVKTLPLSQEVSATKSSSPLKSASCNIYDSPRDHNCLSSISKVVETVGSKLPASTEKGPVAVKEHSLNNIIDKLFSSQEVLRDQEGAALLQECLQFKPMVVGKLQLPITPGTPPDTRSKTSVRRNTPAISFLQKQNLERDTVSDPYTCLPDDAPCAGEPSSSVINGVALTFPNNSCIAEHSITAASVNDMHAPSSNNRSKFGIEEMLKSQRTLDLSASDSSSTSEKGLSKLPSSRNLASSGIEQGDDSLDDISVDLCPTDKSPTPIVKPDVDKEHLPHETHTHMLNSLSSNAFAEDSLTEKQFLLDNGLAKISELSAAYSCAREPTSTSEQEIMNGNSHCGSIEQKGSKSSSKGILKSPNTSALKVHGPVLCDKGIKLSFGRILRSPTERNHSGNMVSDDFASNLSYHSINKLTENISGKNDHGGSVGSIGIEGLSKEKDDDTRGEVVTQKQPGPVPENLHLESVNPTETQGSTGTVSGSVADDIGANPQTTSDQPEVESPHEKHEQAGFSEEPSRSGMATDSMKSGHLENLSISGEHIENDAATRVTKKVVHNRSKRQKSRGKSLAGDGTKWEAGLRRSTREKFRPLEHWRGERLLYGRIHESLATVIGVKCSSPGGGNLKVKSFVSHEYAELVERSALH